MTNMTVELKGDSLVITIPNVTKTHGASSSGKTLVVATTNGTYKLSHPKAPGLAVGVNVWVPNPDKG